MVKVYAAYFKSSDDTKYQLYAFTTDKKVFKDFLNSRNKNLFKTKVFSLRESEVKVAFYSTTDRSKQIIKDNLYDGNDDIPVYCTIDESNQLSESCDYIIKDLQFISSSFAELGNEVDQDVLTQDELDLIIEITNKVNSYATKKLQPFANLNTLELFYHLFKKTFDDTSSNK